MKRSRRTLSGSDTPAKPPHHRADGGFQNPYLSAMQNSLLLFLRARFGDENWALHASQVERIETRSCDPLALSQPADQPRATWLGHSTFLLQHGQRNVLTDPVFSDRVSPFGFAGPRRLVPLPLTIDQLPPIDLVVISHNHYDHLDRNSVRQLGNRTRYAVPLGLKRWLVSAGIQRERIEEFDWWQAAEVGGIEVTATPAQHWSGRGLRDRNRTLWASFHLNIGGFLAWFAGDTGYNEFQFRQIGQRLGGMDLALIPIGAYAPRWFMKPQHIDPEEAVRIHEEIGARLSIAMHWGTFQLSAEEIDAPRQRLETALRRRPSHAAPFITLPIGATRKIEIERGAGGVESVDGARVRSVGEDLIE